MRLSAFVFASLLLPACGGGSDRISLEDEYALRLLRETYHAASTNGDRELLRSLFAEDAELTVDGTTYRGADAIVDYLAGKPEFGESLFITLESHWTAETGDGPIRFGFDTVAVDTGGNDPDNTELALLGAQNPDVEIVEHCHSTGEAVRIGDAQWVIQNVVVGLAPLPPGTGTRNLGNLRPDSSVEDPSIADEVGFRRMRENFHLAGLIGSKELLRSVWAEDGVFVGGGVVKEGREAIVEFMSSDPTWGKTLTLTPESSARFRAADGVGEFAYECIWVSVVGVEHPEEICLCDTDGSQNPLAQIFRHTHATGIVEKLEDGRWVLKEFYGGSGPLPPEPE